MMWSDYGWGWGYHWLIPVLILIFFIWALTTFSRVFFGRRGWHGGCHMHGHGHEDSALEILRQRYARGEVNKEDFEKMRKDLEG